MKLLGMTGVVLCFFGLGVLAAVRLLRRHQADCKTVNLIRFIETKLRYSKQNAYDIAAEASACPEFSDLAFLKAGLKDGKTFREAVREAGRKKELSGPVCEALLDFSELLGKTDLEGQLANCASCISALSKCVSDSKPGVQTKARLYPLLGLMAGVLIVLALL